MASNQAFYKTDRRLGVNVLVRISSCEDRGDYYYISWAPLHWFSNGQRVPGALDQGAHGCSRFYKQDCGKGDKFVRAPYAIVDASHFGCGQIAARPL